MTLLKEGQRSLGLEFPALLRKFRVLPPLGIDLR